MIATDANRTFGKLGNAALVVSLLALLAVIGFWSAGSKAMLQSYLFGYTFWLTMTLGGLGLKVLHHTVRWSVGLSWLRLLEATSSWKSILVMGVLFLPIVFGMGDLYHWLHPGEDPVLLKKSVYLNETWWSIRTVIYFAVWALFAAVLDRSSQRQDRTGDPREFKKREAWGAIGIVVYVLSVSFAFTDWLMSIDSHWFSSIYGIWIIAGSTLAMIAFGTLVVCSLRDKEPYRRIVAKGLTLDMGNLLLALTMFWCYISLSQFLIIWSGNLPEFTTYYYARSVGGWGLVAALVIVMGFFVTFLVLLNPRVKKDAKSMVLVAAWILLTRVMDMYFIVVPSLRPVATPLVQDLVAFVFVGCVWLALFGLQAKSLALLPAHDRRLEEAVQHA